MIQCGPYHLCRYLIVLLAWPMYADSHHVTVNNSLPLRPDWFELYSAALVAYVPEC